MTAKESIRGEKKERIRDGIKHTSTIMEGKTMTETETYRNKSCKERVTGKLKDRIEDLTKLWEAYQKGEEDVEDLGNIFEYGLSFDYVPKGTFKDQRKGYFRYQLSWGGPSDEFRFYCDETFTPYRIEYWFLDWFDGANKVLTGKNLDLLTDIFDWFKEGGTVEAEYKKAKEG